MTAVTVDDALEQRRAKNREAQRRWAERHGRPTTEREQAAERQRAWRARKRLGVRTQPAEHRHSGTRENDFPNVGPAIAAGEWAVDDFDWTEREWTRCLAGARFSDVEVPRF